jgi:hypothetical protein
MILVRAGSDFQYSHSIRNRSGHAERLHRDDKYHTLRKLESSLLLQYHLRSTLTETEIRDCSAVTFRTNLTESDICVCNMLITFKRLDTQTVTIFCVRSR